MVWVMGGVFLDAGMETMVVGWLAVGGWRLAVSCRCYYGVETIKNTASENVQRDAQDGR